MKGNPKWIRRRVGDKCRILMLVSILVMVAWKVWDILSLGEGGARRRGDRWRHGGKSYLKGGLSPQETEEAILEARVHLVDLHIPVGALSPAAPEDYSRVKAIFCEVNWSLQKNNPSTVAMFRDLVGKSPGCERKMEVDLKDIVTKARAFDESSRGVFALPPKGFVFHETRCGSTLVANLLASFDPSENRVYSESQPPVTALKACEGVSESLCDPNRAAKVLQDVVYLMGRTNNIEEQNVFYKIQSVGVRSISVFRKAFPTIPWLFVYRDSVEVFMSHYKNGLKGGAVCMRAKNNPPPVLQQLVKRHGRDMKRLSNEEFCAAHLASLCDAALREHELSQTGRFVNYEQLPDAMWESVLPDYFGIPMGDKEIERMQKASGVYSKGGRGKKANQAWAEDSTKKQEAAPAKVKDACQVFLTPAYQKMELFSKEFQSA